VYAVISVVEAHFVDAIPATLIADMAPPLLAVKDAVLEDPKVRWKPLVVGGCGHGLLLGM